MSWIEELREQRNKAVEVLQQVKAARSQLNTHIVRVNATTWVEQSLTPSTHTSMTHPTITRSQAEEAIALYQTAKSLKNSCEAQIDEAERILEAFGRQNFTQFIDNRLALDSGTLALRGGAARPLRGGRPLPSAARAELAVLLPPIYTRLTCDFGQLFGCPDKEVRELLRSRGIEVVRDDKFVVL